MNFVVVIEAEVSVQRGRDVLKVNDVRSIYPKESSRVIRWIGDGLMSWVDKAKAQQFIEQRSVERKKSGDTSAARLDNSNERSDIRRSNYAEAITHSSSPEEYGQSNGKDLNDAANIVENFENPKNELRFSEIEDAQDKSSDVVALRVAGKKGSLKSRGPQIQEAIQDKDIKLHRLQKAVKDGGGEITDQTNLYEALSHSDRGVQYTCSEFTQLLSKYQMIRSNSRKGDCWDSAVAESFFKTIKCELIYQFKRLLPAEQMRTEIFSYIETWSNRRRRHSALGNLSIQEFYNKIINRNLLIAS